MTPAGRFGELYEDGTRVVTRAKYLSSDGMCHGRPAALPMPFEWVAATITVNGRRDWDIVELVLVFESGIEDMDRIFLVRYSGDLRVYAKN